VRGAPTNRDRYDRSTGEASLSAVLIAALLAHHPRGECSEDLLKELFTLARHSGRRRRAMTEETDMGEPSRVTYLRPDDLRILDDELDDHERRLRRLERRTLPRDVDGDIRLKELLPIVVIGCILRRVLK
jgi:hypothetical protein